MEVTPGEPVPPGFEEEVNKVAHIQTTVDNDKTSALVGLEYTIELHEADLSEPAYLCVLCDKRADKRNIVAHWCSLNHRLKYLEKHYPTAVRECTPVRYKPNSHGILAQIVQSLVEAIEDFHGRLRVKVMDADEFRRQKTRHTESIFNAFHHDEKNGPNFLNSIDRTLFEYNVYKQNPSEQVAAKNGQKRSNPTTSNAKASQRRDEFDAISSDSDNPDSSKKCRINKQQPPYEQHSGEPVKKLPTPKELSLQASHIAQERYKWEKYRCMLDIQVKEMDKLQREYEKSPEKHPLYPEEWKMFWNRRYKELQAENKDPNKYNYKPEWIIFWTKRMKEMYNDELEKKEKEIKAKLDLPEEAEERTDQLKERYKIPVNRMSRPAKQDVIDISDDEAPPGRRHNNRMSRRSRSRSRSRSPRGSRGREVRRRSKSRNLSLSPFSDDYDMNKHHHVHKSHRSAPMMRGHNPMDAGSSMDYYKYGATRYPPSKVSPYSHPHSHSHIAGGPYRVLDSSKIPKYEDSNSQDGKEDSVADEDTGPLTVVGVLRLLTALEEQLGSLGPKVVDLLAKALALEKVKANSSDELLLNEDNSVFFETIKEKLKGLLIADVLEEQHKVRAVKKAIKDIAALIHQVTKDSLAEENGAKKARVAEATAANNLASQHFQSVKGGTPSFTNLPFDRQMVSTKLASALVTHGRDDVSTEDMDRLIYFFVLMVKLSKPKIELDGKPLHCKDILPELGIPAVNITDKLSTLADLPSLVEGLLENETSTKVTSGTNKVLEPEVAEKDSPKNDNSSALESLTDSDLQTLLQNFKHLSNEEQHHLVAHLKKLESVDRGRVEKLRKFINLSDFADTAGPSTSSPLNNASGSESSPFPAAARSNYDSPISASAKSGKPDHTPRADEQRASVNPNKFSLDDDDDDDYNFDEMFKAASKNLNDEASRHSMSDNKAPDTAALGALSSQNDLTFNPSGLKGSLSDTQNLIANLMGSLQQSNSASKSTAATAKPNTSATKGPQPVPPVMGSNHQTASRVSAQQTQPHPSEQQRQAMPYYDQQQNYPGAAQQGMFNQMQNHPANYYNGPMGGGYNQAYGGGGGYPQWGGQNMPMGAYGMHNYNMPPQGGQPHPHMSYNMYGQGGH